MDEVARLSLLQNLYTISAVVAVLGFAMAILLFFVFDIRTLFLIQSGRAKSRAVERMRLREESGASMREKTPSGHKPGSPVAPLPAGTGGAATEKVISDNSTTLLSGEKLNTTVLSGVVTERTSAGAEAPMPEAPRHDISGLRFEVTEKILFIHTDELI